VLDYAAFVALAALYGSHTVRLSGESLALLLCTATDTEAKPYWRGADTISPSPSEWDEIEALAAKAYGELMVEEEAAMIFPFVTADPPTGSLECDGAEYLRVDYPDLYAVLDSAFIVDADNFAVPDLRGRSIIGVGQGAGLTERFVNDAGGEETHILAESELAAHDHGVTDPGHDHNYTKPFFNSSGRGTGSSSYQTQTTDNTSPGFTSISIDSTGGDAGHENMPPFLALRYALWVI